MFKPESGMMHLLKSMVPPEFMQQITEAAVKVPAIIENVQNAMVSIDRRLESIQLQLDRLEMKMDPSAAAPVTSLSLLDGRVQENAFSEDDQRIMTDSRLTTEDIAMLDKHPPKIIN